MNNLPKALKNSRCILHIDLDCFYCQVEQVRLGIPFDVPAGVQQWRGLIAVNYAARKAGVERHADIDEARKICPDIKLLHVATYGPNDTEPKYHENPDKRTHKVCLDPYRNASREIFKIFYSYCDKIQKIGSDEGFLDVTETVTQRLMEKYVDRMPHLLDRLDDQVCGVEVEWDKLGVVVTSKEEECSIDGNWSPTTWRDLQLAIGAELAAEIRKEVYDKLQYTCSAGIAHYKTVAKLCSSKNKPNKQTVLREIARLDFMQDVPFKKIRNLGGKLGSEVGTDLEVTNASELWKYSEKELQEKFGHSTGLYIYHICRGVDDEEVVPTKAPQSLMAAKSFNPAIQNPTEMEPWFSILSVEMHIRIMRNYKEFGTWPKNISLRCRNMGTRSKTMGTIHLDAMKTHENLLKRFKKCFETMENGYPCYGLDLVASGLSKDAAIQSHTLNKYFTTASASAHTNTSAHNNDTSAHNDTETITNDHNTNESSKPETTKEKLFFKKQAQQKEIDTWVCDKCNQKVFIRDIDEHTDYHYALEISEEMSKDKRSGSTLESKKKKLNKFFNSRS